VAERGARAAAHRAGASVRQRRGVRPARNRVAALLAQVKGQLPGLDLDFMTEQLKLWADPNLHERAPGLAAQRVLRNGKRRNLDRNSQRSDMVDLHHAQYLPYVDIFTADRQNAALLRPHLDLLRRHRASRLIRVGRLMEVSDTIAELAALRVG
jgi:hypothetical protein